MPGPLFKGSKVRRKQYRNKLVFIADERGIGHKDIVLQLVLNRLRRHQLAARSLQQFLLAIGDEEKPVLIEAGNVAGVEPSVGVEALRVGLGFVPVPLKHRWPASQ